MQKLAPKVAWSPRRRIQQTRRPARPPRGWPSRATGSGSERRCTRLVEVNLVVVAGPQKGIAQDRDARGSRRERAGVCPRRPGGPVRGGPERKIRQLVSGAVEAIIENVAAISGAGARGVLVEEPRLVGGVGGQRRRHALIEGVAGIQHRDGAGCRTAFSVLSAVGSHGPLGSPGGD